MSNPAAEWWSSLPPLTKLYGAACLGATLASRLALLSPVQLALLWPLVTRRLQLWRLLTCFCYLGPPSMNFLITLFWLYRYGVDLERNAYPGRPADYLWAVVWLVGLLLASTAAHAAVFLGPALVNALLFTWSRFNPTARVSFFGIFTVDGVWLPFVMLGWSLASGSPGWVEELRGIAAGHTLHFLATAWPSRGGPQLVRTPGAVAAFVQWAYGGYDTVNTAYVRPAAPAPFQGRGRRLNE